MEPEVREISGCSECPFISADYKCSKCESIEIDPELMDDDLSTLCPLRDGKIHVTDSGESVKLADWILRTSVSNIDD